MALITVIIKKTFFFSQKIWLLSHDWVGSIIASGRHIVSSLKVIGSKAIVP